MGAWLGRFVRKLKRWIKWWFKRKKMLKGVATQVASVEMVSGLVTITTDTIIVYGVQFAPGVSGIGNVSLEDNDGNLKMLFSNPVPNFHAHELKTPFITNGLRLNMPTSTGSFINVYYSKRGV